MIGTRRPRRSLSPGAASRFGREASVPSGRDSLSRRVAARGVTAAGRKQARRKGSTKGRGAGEVDLAGLRARVTISASLSRPGSPSGPVAFLRAAGDRTDRKVLDGLISWLDEQGAVVLSSLVRAHLDSMARIGAASSGLIIG